MERNSTETQNKTKPFQMNIKRAKEAHSKSQKSKRATKIEDVGKVAALVPEKSKTSTLNVEELDIHFDSFFNQETTIETMIEKIEAVDLNAKEETLETNIDSGILSL